MISLETKPLQVSAFEAEIYPAHLGPVSVLVAKLVEDRVEKTLASLVVSSRNKTLDAQEALSGIALIAGLRALALDLDSKVRNAQK